MFDLQFSLNRALSAAKAGLWDQATKILTQWDQRLQSCGGTHLWFETRLRLIALKRAGGQQKQAEALARPLELRARQANDWLTIRRLDVLMSTVTPSLIAAFQSGPVEPTNTSDAGEQSALSALPEHAAAASESTTSENVPTSSETESGSQIPAEDSAEEQTPLSAEITMLRERMTQLMEDPTEEAFVSLRQDVLSYQATQVTHFDDAASLIHLMAHLTGSAEDGEQVWQWANSLAAAHRDVGVVLSVLGFLGDMLRISPNTEMAEKITADRTEQLHRKALELDGDRARNHMRAGDHFLRENNLGEAERCFARAFRLDRSLPDVVERLADLYNDTDRPRDALYVLDLSLREGCIEPRIAFNAAMVAFRLNQFETVLTYLDRYEYLEGDNLAWASYYRAVCYYELDRFEEALESLDRAEAMAESSGWHLEAVRACSLARLGRTDEAEAMIQQLMEVRLSEIDYISVGGLASLLERLMTVADEVLHDSALSHRIETRLLRSGLMPESWFQKLREHGTEKPDVRLYRFLVIQPLDESWENDPDRLVSEYGWSMYAVEWGVLAESEESAQSMALEWQSRCSEVEAWIEEFQVSEETYTDIPGVVWQGARIPWGTPEDDEEDDDPDSDDSADTDESP